MGKQYDVRFGAEGPLSLADGGCDMIANRHQARHAMLVDSFRHVIADSTVLFLGAEDGRWCCDMAAAGALRVIGAEENADLVNAFLRLPGVGMRERIDMRVADPLMLLVDEVRAKAQHDVVVLFDVLEDEADLHAVLAQIAALSPLMVLGDGLFARTDVPLLRIEKHRGPVSGRERPRLIPSRGALSMAAEAAGFEVDWADWDMLPEHVRGGLSDYYQSGPMVRASFTLLPQDR
ncbi:MAG: class I SAM-dependent methyltransferase [Rhodobacteraceae bacterium]|nr:class I SAM-dependent methyltransferase [Paracoccaceae bacterium]